MKTTSVKLIYIAHVKYNTPSLSCKNDHFILLCMARIDIFLPEVSHGEAKICDATFSVFLDQNISTLDISMGDGRLSLRAEYLRVQMRQATGDGEHHCQQTTGFQHCVL